MRTLSPKQQTNYSPNDYPSANDLPFFHIKLGRRTFLNGSFAGFMTLLSGKLSSLPMSFLGSKVSLLHLHLSDFHQLLGQRFALLHKGQFLGMVQLDVVKDRSQSSKLPANSSHECFSLAFCAPSKLIVPQDTYTFAHPKLGLLDLFIVPMAPQVDEQRYIAIINRI